MERRPAAQALSLFCQRRRPRTSFASEGIGTPSSWSKLSRTMRRLRRQRNRPYVGERLSELCQHHEVGVNPHPVKAARAELPYRSKSHEREKSRPTSVRGSYGASSDC